MASFVGDVNILRARLDRVSGAIATVILGETAIQVPAGPLNGLPAGADVELFVRPEQLRVASATNAAATQGVVGAQIYQGGHVDIYIDSSAAASGRLLIRLSDAGAIARWPVGERVGVTLDEADAVAFPASGP